MKTRKFRIKIPCCIVILGMIWLAVAPGSTFAQVATPSQKLVADSSAGAPGTPATDSAAPKTNAAPNTNTLTNAEVLVELERMRARIQELEAQLKAQSGVASVGESSSQPPTPASGTAPATIQVSVEKPPQTEMQQPAEPFAFADWTWLNGAPRTKELPLDTKFF